MADTHELVRRANDDGVLTLTLCAAPRRNALSLELRLALERALAEGLADHACRVVVVTGDGDHFCAGGDISGMEGVDAVTGRHRLASAHRIIRMIVEGEKPVIAAVEGYAVGAGLSLAAACDIVVASRTARFACSFNRLGLVPDFGAAFTLPQRLGAGRARYVILTGDTFDAATAEQWGLVEVLTEPGEAHGTALAIGRRICSEAAPLSNAFAKRLLGRMPTSLDDVLKAETDSQAILYTSRDFAEGRDAFLAKRKPVFDGR